MAVVVVGVDYFLLQGCFIEYKPLHEVGYE